jgi:PAS domain S-box-containing protein
LIDEYNVGDSSKSDELIKLQSINEILHSIVQYSSDGLFVVNDEGIVIEVNKAYEEMTGISKKEVINRNIRDLVLNQYFDKSAASIALDTKKKTTIIQQIKQQKYFVVTANPILDKNQKVSMVVTSVRDISYLYHLQKQLQDSHHITNNTPNTLYNQPDFYIVYNSPQMKMLYQKIEQISQFPTNILITGDSGTGKEVLANLIHQLSSKSNQPFIKVNCSAIPNELFESEMFGFTGGSFTGAKKEGKPGFFEQANNGTILLDEIGEIPIQFQVKLLRVLQEKSITRIGSTKPINLSFRLICSTNQNLERLIHEKKFRLDLWYRINVVQLKIPPLKSRKDDIPPLVEQFKDEFCNKYKLTKQILPETMNKLIEYDWPGNVRELRNVIEYVIISTLTSQVGPADLPDNIRENWNLEMPLISEDEFSDQASHLLSKEISLKSALEQYETEIIISTLKRTSSIRSAAQQLKIDHSSLIRKMRRLNITY